MRSRFLSAALDAVGRGWSVFPLVPAGKTPAIRDWEARATTDIGQVYRWWAGDVARNVGVAAGRSGLVVIDLDQGGGDVAPERFAGARNGWEALAMLADEAGVEVPADTYTVTTPGGCHLYFRAPAEVALRNTVGTVGWRIDTRAHGGYVVGAGSMRDAGLYEIKRGGPIVELPDWLLHALTPAPPEPRPPMQLSTQRASAYVRAIVDGEVHNVGVARTGTRHHNLLKAARTLGRLVGGGELAEDDARGALLGAAARHVGVDGCTVDEVTRTIDDGLGYGMRLPRRIARRHRAAPVADQLPPSPSA